MSGWIKLDRDLRESLPFVDDKFSRYEAWLDLVSLANWEDKIWISRKGPIEVKRGSFITSLATLSERWKWSKSAVRCFLNYARTAAQIAHASRTDYTLITILDYDRYQAPTETNARTTHASRTECSTENARTTAPTKEEELRNKKEEEEVKEDITLAAKPQRPPTHPKIPKKQFGEFVFLTEDEHQKFLLSYGGEFLEACIRKLDGWIGSNPIPKRKTNGRNAAATFRAWVFDAVSEQHAKAEKFTSISNSNGFHKQKLNHTEEVFLNAQRLREIFANEEN